MRRASAGRPGVLAAVLAAAFVALLFAPGAAAVELAYQACDERRCLPPVTRLVRLR